MAPSPGPQLLGATPWRSIKASLFSALDGVVDPMVGNWHFPYFNEEMGEAVGDTHATDVMLFGRVTYDSFAGAWPEREAAGGDDADFATPLGDVRKIVASHQPLEFTWRSSEQLDGELVEAVTALKADPLDRAHRHQRIGVDRPPAPRRRAARRAAPVRAPGRRRVRTSPLRGRRPRAPVEVDSVRPFATGVVYLVYAPDPDPPTGAYDDAKKVLADD